MSYADEMREQIRRAKLRQCQEDPRGTAALQVTLGAAAAVTVYAVVRSLDIAALEALGLQQAAQGLRVELPRQTAGDSPGGDSFQGGLLPGDKLVHGGLAYRVQHVERDDMDTVFTLIATRDEVVQQL
ncbi:MAG TPA: hypothetical protein VL860_07135 [Planctomycetota bacterium]|nr:hypothetical protein [Planctomycetota bacterium]